MDSNLESFNKIEKEIQGKAVLVAVSKRKSQQAIWELYRNGQRIFGENQVQELAKKYEDLPKDIQWHFIGHLQTNKVKYIAPFISVVHAVDSFKLLTIINKEALKNKRTIKCLLQFHIAEEETKYGMSIDEAFRMLRSNEYGLLQYNQAVGGAEIIGVMGMATYTSDIKQVSSEFSLLKKYFDQLKIEFFNNQSSFKELSMGMSQDYNIAVEKGSTMVRIGSLIFGDRL